MVTEVRSAMIRQLLTQWSHNSFSYSHNSKMVQHVNIENTMQTLCAVILLMCDCFSQRFLWLKQLLGHKKQNHTSSWKLYSEVVTDVLLFKSVEFVSVSIDCVIRGKIHRWLVQSLSVVAYSFAFFIWHLCNSRFSPLYLLLVNLDPGSPSGSLRLCGHG